MAGKGIRALLMGCTLALVIATGLGFGLWAARERMETIEAAEGSMLHTGRLLAAALDAELAGIDTVLAGGGEALAAMGWPERDPQALAMLQRLSALAPAARGIVVTGADGRTRYGTNLPRPFEPVDLADRAYVRVHSADPASKPFLSEPLLSRNDGSRIVVVSRRLAGPDGGFAGVIAATIALDNLEALAQRSFHAPATAVRVLDRRGITLLRLPDPGIHVGRSLAASPVLERLGGRAEGIESTASVQNGRERVLAFVRNTRFDLTTFVSAERDELLEGWRQRMLVSGLLAGLACTVICWLAWHLLLHIGQLARAQAAADRANVAKTAFLANMSHELRTPLNAIVGFTDAMLHGVTGEPCGPRSREYLGHVLASGSHLLGVINEVLDLSKVEEGRIVLNVVEVDLAAVVREAVVLVAGAAEARGVRLEGPSAPEPVPVRGDPQRLRQVALNLVSNAVKFTGRGGTVEVKVVATPAGEVDVVVVDNGIGMTADEVAVALTPFGQVASEMTSHEAGTGLGLPLARRLVELSGGRLVIDSVKGAGTRVTVRLPGLR